MPSSVLFLSLHPQQDTVWSGRSGGYDSDAVPIPKDRVKGLNRAVDEHGFDTLIVKAQGCQQVRYCGPFLYLDKRVLEGPILGLQFFLQKGKGIKKNVSHSSTKGGDKE